jgi:acetyl-CoA carboxylase biotin carboxyl carrier protein
MADGVPEGQSPDLKTLHKLIRLMHRYGLTAMDLGEGPNKIRLRRGSVVSTAANIAAAEPVAAPVAPATSAPATASSKPAEAEGQFIRSPMVGTFYTSSSPDAPPFVSVGTNIRKESTVCIIEAMKVFTEIPAGTAGTVTEILVKNGQAVEFGQPLFRLA